MTNLLIASGATLIGFFVGLVITALIKKAGDSKDDTRFNIMLEHHDIIEARLSRYADNADRTADALETIVKYLEKR
ncbi:hypothetical protein [Methylophaga sp.]|uniref:hypothetical protein n=1 Tax=Methylophaga sp. TaxID=2024840 RepID=UPI003A93668E